MAGSGTISEGNSSNVQLKHLTTGFVIMPYFYSDDVDVDGYTLKSIKVEGTIVKPTYTLTNGMMPTTTGLPTYIDSEGNNHSNIKNLTSIGSITITPKVKTLVEKDTDLEEFRKTTDPIYFRIFTGLSTSDYSTDTFYLLKFTFTLVDDLEASEEDQEVQTITCTLPSVLGEGTPLKLYPGQVIKGNLAVGFSKGDAVVSVPKNK